jgi:hypothetical protein
MPVGLKSQPAAIGLLPLQRILEEVDTELVVVEADESS